MHPHAKPLCCQKSAGKELGNLFQSFKDTKGIDVSEFIPGWEVPRNERVTEPWVGFARWPEKIGNPFRSGITAWGHLSECDSETATNSTSIWTIKMLLNSVSSTQGAKFSTLDIKSVHPKSLLWDSQCTRFNLSQTPKDFQSQHNLHALVDNPGCVCAQINWSLHRLEENGSIANEDIVVDHSLQFGRHEIKHTAGLFTHVTRPIQFSLVVDDFGVKWVNHADLNHLLESPRTKHTMTCDSEWKQFAEMHLQWNCDTGKVVCSMDWHVKDALRELEVTKSKRHFKGPTINCGARIQFVKDGNSPSLTPHQIEFIQQVIRKFLFMARAADNTLLLALHTTCMQMSEPMSHPSNCLKKQTLGTNLHSFPQLSIVVVWSKSWFNAYFLAFHCTNKNLIFLLKNSSYQMLHVRDSAKTSTEHWKTLFNFPLCIWTRIDRFSHATIFWHWFRIF